MTINGKRDEFTRKDLLSLGESISVARPESILDEILATVAKWPEFASQSGILASLVNEIGKTHRFL